MAKNITLMGANYPDVPAVDLPRTGGGTARFVDMDELLKFYTVVLPDTGSVAAGDNKTVSKAISDFIDSGYSVMAVIPIYAGDNQFCFNTTSFDSTNVIATIRNVSSAADSGSPTLRVIAMKNS